MIILKTKEEIEIMRQGGKILAEILNKIAEAVKPGITTAELNEIAEKLIFEAGAMPAFKGYQNFPTALCTSVNEEIVHAVPSERKLEEGDIIGLDLGILYPAEKCSVCPYSKDSCGGTPGLYTDAAITVAIGKVESEAENLIRVARKALEVGLEQIKPGNHLGDIGYAIQKYVESEGFSVVRDLVGHGIGKELHEDPEIPNFGQPGNGPELKEGMTLAIEPMISAGQPHIQKTKDGFGYQTLDKTLAAHFEQTIVVTKDGFEALTPF